jgi:hypothetical protein
MKVPLDVIREPARIEFHKNSMAENLAEPIFVAQIQVNI